MLDREQMIMKIYDMIQKYLDKEFPYLSPEDREDLIQDACVYALEHYETNNNKFVLNRAVRLNAVRVIKDLMDPMEIPVDIGEEVMWHLESVAEFKEMQIRFLRSEFDKAFETMRPRRVEVLRRFYGIGCPEETKKEIAKDFGVTPNRIGQIYAGAMRNMFHPSRWRRVVDWYNDPD